MAPATDVPGAESEEEMRRRQQAEQERNSPEVPVAAPESGERPNAGTLTPEQDREAILRMIAEGCISPEEGDLLLEALGG